MPVVDRGIGRQRPDVEVVEADRRGITDPESPIRFIR